jgi:hypothetical protein
VASTVYELTAAGHELGVALAPLTAWGLRHAVPETPGDRQVCATWSVLPFTHAADPEMLAGIEATYELRIGESSVLMRVHDGHAVVLADESADALVRQIADLLQVTPGGAVETDDDVTARLDALAAALAGAVAT